MLMIVRLLLVCATLIAITGCGQKGPLFLPGDPGEVQRMGPATEPSENEEDEEEDEDSTGSQR